MKKGAKQNYNFFLKILKMLQLKIANFISLFELDASKLKLITYNISSSP